MASSHPTKKKPELKPGTATVAVLETKSEPADLGPRAEKPANAKIEKPAPLKSANGGRRRSALSLSSLKRKKLEEAEAQKKREAQKTSGDLPEESFTEEAFRDVWKKYVDSLHQKGEKILASILMADKPLLKGQMIHVTYPNQLMKQELLKVRPRVLKHLRGELKNHSVDFIIEVKEDTAKRFAYTPQEKYELLKEKNKDISLLRKTFNLEL